MKPSAEAPSPAPANQPEAKPAPQAAFAGSYVPWRGPVLLTLLAGLVLILGVQFWMVADDARIYREAVNNPQLYPAGYPDHPAYDTIRERVEGRQLFLGPDSFYWVVYASHLVETGSWRIRHTEVDNPPDGREVHWNSASMWWLVTLGKVRSIFTGEDHVTALENAAPWANPILFALAMTLMALAVTRRMGVIPGLLTALVMLHFKALQDDISYANVDHHGIQLLAALGQIVTLVLAGAGYFREEAAPKLPTQHESLWLRAPVPLTREEARRWFIWAGVFGALGLWFGATPLSIVIGACGAGGLLAGMLLGGGTAGTSAKTTETPSHPTETPQKRRAQRQAERRAKTKRPPERRRKAPPSPSEPGVAMALDPSLWRWWSWSGAALGMVFYLIEYFPHGSMRLEVIHPFFLLAWLGGGEAVYRLLRWRMEGLQLKELTKHLPWLAGATVLVMIMPLAVLKGPDSWHNLNDMVMRRLHSFIFEFQPLLKSPLPENFLRNLIEKFGAVPLLFLLGPMAFLVFLPRAARATLLMVWIPSLVLAGFYLWQKRWAGLTGTTFIAMLVVALGLIGHIRPKGTGRAVALTFLAFLTLIPQIFLFQYYRLGDRGEAFRHFDKLMITFVTRDTVIGLGVQNRGEPVTIFADNTFAPVLAYYDLGKSVGSLYWENTAGVRAVANFFASTTDEEAAALIRKHGVDHVVAQDGLGTLARMFTYSATGSTDIVRETQSLGYRLMHGEVPKWLRKIPLPPSPVVNRYKMVAYRVVVENLPPDPALSEATNEGAEIPES